MKINQKQYQKAKDLLQKAREAQKTVKAWEAAKESLAPNQKLKSVKVGEDGSITAECTIDSQGSGGASETQPKPSLSVDKQRRA